MKRLLCAAFLSLLCGCSAVGWRAGDQGAAPCIAQPEAVALAKREIRKRNADAWGIRSQAEFRDGRWTVTSRFTVPADLLGLFQEERRCAVVVDCGGRVLSHRSLP
ncbi:MAG: hypothetical protein IT574_03970 [Candidatus Aureabacteria bacterium]|nr:hypothetical protein [Candidatus Auribacterota bacterium]HOE26653.1 hypothetical protein [bacterium]HQM51633.1 hypothetical protein [bacterium]